VIGQREFMGVPLLVAPDVLVPRAETELLGETARRLLLEVPGTPVVVDMCCGSGNLACALAQAVPRARVVASDLTDACVALARRNVARLGLEDRVAVAQGDLFEALDPALMKGNVDLVVCNPPYISSGRLARDRAELLVNEPREAFDGGPFGVTIQQRVLREAATFLRPGGWLAFEIGLGQDRQMKAMFERASEYQPPHPVRNQAGEARVMMARRS
jgi:release factor glutamine methyltransferase